MGNLQQLPGGGAFVGWGTYGAFTEFTADGAVCFDASFGDGSVSYRAFRLPWVGRPTGRPAVAAVANGGVTTVYASWNGATEVASWQALTGATAGSLKPARGTRRTGFETAIPVAAAGAYVAVAALDAKGKVLGTSMPSPCRPASPAGRRGASGSAPGRFPPGRSRGCRRRCSPPGAAPVDVLQLHEQRDLVDDQRQPEPERRAPSRCARSASARRARRTATSVTIRMPQR